MPADAKRLMAFLADDLATGTYESIADTEVAIARPSSGGTALPICRAMSVMEPVKR